MLSFPHDDSGSSTEVTHGENKDKPETLSNCTNAVDAANLQCSEDAAGKCTNICSIEGQHLGQDQSLFIPVRVSGLKNPLTCPLNDSQSNATFINEK